MSKRTIRCCQTALLVVAVLVLGTGMARAGVVCPPGAPAVGGDHTTGLPTTKTCPGQTLPGQTYICTFHVTNADLNHCVENLTFTDTAPPGLNPVLVQCLQSGSPVTLLAWSGAPGSTDSCTGSVTRTAPNNCGPGTLAFTDRIDSAGTDRGDLGAPCGATDQYCGLPSAGVASGTTNVPPLVCLPAGECTVATCTVAAGCGVTGIGDSTPCTDTDSNNCTAAGCEGIVCAQAHVTTPCSPTNECNTAACDATHTCIQSPAPPSTPCADTDANNCTAAGCEAGACVQAHVTTPCSPTDECNTAACDATHTCVQSPVPPSTPCTDTDADNCTTAGCEAGACVQAHVTTPCTPNECNTAACDASHVCVQTPVPNSDPCTDTDADACTTAGCEAGLCVQAHITDPTCGAEFCRTPGFWGTHGCLGGTLGSPDGVCEKLTSQNITQLVLNEFGGTLSICGTIINNTDVGNVNSALEAICVSPKGDSRLQLARQLTAAALNCGITNSSGAPGSCTVEGGATPCAGVSIGNVFDLCNAACPTGTTIVVNDINGTPTTLSCIGLLDCFNNGGGVGINPVTGLPECGFGPACDENLVNGCFDFGTPGPAGSSKACNDARKNDVTVVPPLIP